MVFNDNRYNGNNGKNRRNDLCHEVTYNKDNGDYSAPDVFLRQQRQEQQEDDIRRHGNEDGQ